MRLPISLLGLLLFQIAQATTFLIPPFTDWVQQSPHIVRGRVLSLQTKKVLNHDGQTAIYTFGSFRVLEVLKTSGPQPIPKDEIVIRKIGGTVDGQTLTLAGSPELPTNRSLVLFLGPRTNDDSHEILGLELGEFRVGPDGVLSGVFFQKEAPWSLDRLRQEIRTQTDAQQAEPPPAAQILSPPDLPNRRMQVTSELPPSSASSPNPEPHPKTQDSRVLTALTFIAFGCCLLLFYFFKRKRSSTLKP